jgi:hypothetical protein
MTLGAIGLGAIGLGLPTFGSAVSGGPVAFTDDFNRANENLEVSDNWTRNGGSAGDITIASNATSANSTDTTGAAYLAPDPGSADQYAQATLAGVGPAGPFPVCVRIADVSNFVGARYDSETGTTQLYRRTGGSFTLIDSYVAAQSGGVVFRLEVTGSAVRLLINGVERANGDLGANNATGVPGMVSRLAARNPFVDNWESGAL